MSDSAKRPLEGDGDVDIDSLIGRALLGELDQQGRDVLDALAATDPRVAEALSLLERTQTEASALLVENSARADQLPPFLRPQQLSARLWWRQRIVAAVSLLATARLAHSGASAVHQHGLGGPLSETWPLFFALGMAIALPWVLWKQSQRLARIASGGSEWLLLVDQLSDEAIARWRRRRKLLIGLLVLCGGVGAYLASLGLSGRSTPSAGGWDLAMLLGAALIVVLSMRRR